ncbi:phage tail fiber protein [Cronobacter turicensis]|uniref:phage tail fiber domain-containing protein n=1 Tax=Cronobacter turicensis TaxID=413502 RepID=UPI003570CC3C
MTVSSTAGYIEYTGDGATQTFVVPFYFILNSDISVMVSDDNGNLDELTYGTDFSAVGGGNPDGGSATLNVAYDSTHTILIYRNPPDTQETVYYENGKFPAKSHEKALDKLTMLIQKYGWWFDSLALKKPGYLAKYYDAQGNRIANLADPKNTQDATTKSYVDSADVKALRVPEISVQPVPGQEFRKNKLLAFNDNGDPIAVVPQSGSASDVMINLAKPGGDKLIGSSFGGTVYSDYQPAQLRKKYQFGNAGSVSSQRDAVFYAAENLWYVSKSTTFPVTIPSAPDANWRCVGLLNGYPIYDVRNWGLVGDDYTDNTANFIQMLSKINTEYVTIEFPAGIFRYTNLGKITKNRLTLAGKGSMQTVLKCMNTTADHVAFDIDAWPDPVNPAQPYIDAFNLVGLHIEGNSNTATVLSVQGTGRCVWENVSVWGTKSTGTGIIFKSIQLGRYSNLMCSKYRNLAGQTVNVPLLGMLVTVGTRAGGGEGSPTNNNFISLYMEGVSRGLNMTWGDGNQFLGGSCESNSDYGTNISSNCRFNTFIGMGNENLNASTGDFVDRGRYSKFLNCYSSQRFVAQGFNGLIDGGYFELIEVQSVAIGYEVKNAAVNNWNTGSGGFTDAGSGTRKRSIYDIDTSAFINTTDVRTAVTMSLTPVTGGTRGTWLNDTRLPCTVYVQGSATITLATVSRGGDSVNIPTSSIQAVRLESGDTIALTWSSSGSGPTLSRRTHTEG